VGNFQYTDTPLAFGDLQGNRFTITLRDVRGWNDESPPSILTSEKPSFINYYGLQRFGTGTVPSHLIGVSLLKRDAERAVSLMFSPTPDVDLINKEINDVEDSRRYFAKTRDPLGALDRMPLFMKSERTILQILHELGPNAYANAFHALPRPMRTMYIHAWQSYVWNKLASKRMDIYDSTQPVVGDLVRLASSNSSSNTQSTMSLSDDASSDTPVMNTNDIELTSEDVVEKDLTVDESLIHVITQEDIDEKRYSIEDVLLPLPTPAVKLPENLIGEAFHTYLEADNLNLETFNDSALCREYGLFPTYRYLITTVKDLQWRFLPCVHPFTPLPSMNESYLPPNPSSDSGTSVTALQLSFNLPSSSYATMFLREITHNTTATNPQKYKTINSRRNEENNKLLTEELLEEKSDIIMND
jgi:tRNA pseudouridine13 synthase